MEKRELICIGCPMGCPLTVTLDGGAVVTVQGNTCPRGDAYARREVTAPTRIVTTTVRVTGGALPAVSCKTRSDIQKMTTISVPQMITSDRTNEAIMLRLNTETAKRLDHHMKRARGL